MRCLAIDIGGTKIATAIVQHNQVSQRQQIQTPTDKPQSDQAGSLHQAIGEIMQHYQGQFDFVAVASTGIINKGVLTALNPKNLGGLAEFPLKQSIAKHTDKPIALLNDVQAAVCAEYLNEDQQAVKNFVFITISTGVGGGIILNGELQIGSNGIAGHIGHTLADPNGPLCGCGRVGCVEAVAAGRAIEAVSSQWEQPCSPKEVFERFRQGNPQAVELVQKSAKAIANLIADLKISLDIQKVVLGGSVGLAEGYLPLVSDYLAEMPSVYHCVLENAQSGQDAGLIGAAWWAENQLNQGFTL